MKRASRWSPLIAITIALLAPAVARADDPPAAAAKLPARQANYAWDAVTSGPDAGQTLLRASCSFRDASDAPLAAKLSSGLPMVIAMRAYLFAEGVEAPVALAVRSCRVVYDLWDEVYRIRLSGPGGERDSAAVSTEGVLRQCAEARDLALASRSALRPGTSYFLGVIVDVNPISPEMLDQMRRWVSRPAGSTNLTPSDALFGSFVGLFVRDIGTSDRKLRFRTQSVGR